MTRHKDSGARNAQRAAPGQAQRAENRSENLLPGDDAKDGRYGVAEEVNLDQQSDRLRRVGKPPKGIASKDLPDEFRDDDGAGSGAG
jgi:hypothetical protein